MTRETLRRRRAELIAECERLSHHPDGRFDSDQDRAAFDTALDEVRRLESEIAALEASPEIVRNGEAPHTADAGGGDWRHRARPQPTPITPVNVPAEAAETRQGVDRPVRRETASLDAQLAELEGRDLQPHEACVVFGGTSHSLASVRRQLPTLPPGFVSDIQRQVNAIEDRVYRRDEQRAADAERDAQLRRARDGGPLDPDDQQRIDQLLAEAKADHEYRQSTAGKLDRIATLLERLVEGSRA